MNIFLYILKYKKNLIFAYFFNFNPVKRSSKKLQRIENTRRKIKRKKTDKFKIFIKFDNDWLIIKFNFFDYY